MVSLHPSYRSFLSYWVLVVLLLHLMSSSSQVSVAAQDLTIEHIGSTGGRVQVVAVSGTYAYVGEGSKLTVLDINNPSQPVVLSHLNLPEMIEDIYLYGDYAYIATDYDGGLLVVNISNITNLNLVGSYNITYATSVYVAGNYAYILGSGELHIVDIRNASAPTRVGRIKNVGSADGSVFVSGNYAYITGTKGLQIIDIRNPSTPTVVGILDTPGTARGLAVTAGYAYIADGSGGLHSIDISTPSSPFFAGSISTLASAYDVAVIDNYAYIATDGRGVQIIDISVPANLQAIGNYDTAGQSRSVQVVGDFAYVADSYKGMQIIDISVPAAPMLASSYDTPGSPQSVQIVENYAYIADSLAGIKLVDISTPSDPTLIGSYDTSTIIANDIQIVGSLAYVADGSKNLHIFDISIPSNPTLVSSYDILDNEPRGIDVVNDHIYVAIGSDGLYIIDISSPSTPTLVGTYNTPGIAQNVKVIDSYAYVADHSGGLQIIDIRSPSTPTLVGSYVTTENANDVHVVGDYAYIAIDSAGLQIIDISTPANPSSVGVADPLAAGFGPAFGSAIEVIGSYAYLSEESHEGFYVFDINNPASPTIVSSYDLPGRTMDLYVANDLVYLADWWGGLHILQVTEPVVSTISGTVTNSSGTGVSGVTIAAGSETTTTASDGTYTLSGLTAGSYTVRASKTNCTFSPSSRSVSVPPDATSQNFTATCTIPDTIPPDGYITAPSEGQTIGPSTMTFSASAWDNSGGSGVDRVDFKVYYNGIWHNAGSDSSAPYAVSWTTPDGLTSQQLQFAIWVYDRAGNYVVDPGGKVSVNFEAPTISRIAGTVRDSSGSGVSGVTISAGSTSTTTASNGTYSLNGLAAETYMVTASKADCTFSPSARSVSVPPDATSQNFTADCSVSTYTVSGQVTDGSGNGVSNVTITGGGQSIMTSSNGSYTISGLTAGSYTIRASKTNCTFSPSARSVSVPPDATSQNFTADCPVPTYVVSGRVTDSSGNGVSNVTITGGGQSIMTSSNGSYTISGLTAGNYTLIPSKSGSSFTPTNRSIAVSGNVSGQDFTAMAPSTRTFQVDRDGLSFRNFRYYGADWEHFQKTFPGTPMELPTGERRKGPAAYFADMYTPSGEGGNCAGFTAISLIRFLELPETVEPDLLSPDNRAIRPPWNWPDVLPSPYGRREITVHQHDLADYIHLYQARQQSEQFIRWWNGTAQRVNGAWDYHDRHFDDTPLQTYQAIKDSTRSGTPLAVSIKQNTQGHRMTAYRTVERGNYGYISVYDGNWPGDTTRRIEVNLTTGHWSYALDPQTTWGGTTTGLFYTPASLNFPAQLWLTYDYDITNRLTTAETHTGTMVGIDGTASLLITDDQGRQMGYNGATLIHDIPGAAPIYNLGYNPEQPDADNIVGFYLPPTIPFSVTIQPTTDAGTYTLTAFGNGSAMRLDDISIRAGTADTLVLGADVRQVTFTPAGDQDYCHYLTHEFATASRDFTACVTTSTDATVQFALDAIGNVLTVANQGSDAVDMTTTIHQVGTDAGTWTVNKTIASGTSVTVHAGSDGTVYLPMIIR